MDWWTDEQLQIPVVRGMGLKYGISQLEQLVMWNFARKSILHQLQVSQSEAKFLSNKQQIPIHSYVFWDHVTRGRKSLMFFMKWLQCLWLCGFIHF